MPTDYAAKSRDAANNTTGYGMSSIAREFITGFFLYIQQCYVKLWLLIETRKELGDAREGSDVRMLMKYGTDQ